jgi:hypothetical protein
VTHSLSRRLSLREESTIVEKTFSLDVLLGAMEKENKKESGTEGKRNENGGENLESDPI